MNEAEALCLQGDFLNQLVHVGANAGRLLAMQDQDPLSPSFGCFHYAYWRDKTSDFPDARFQEAAAVLGLLSLDAFDALRGAHGWPSKDSLRASFRAGLHDLARQQYPEGCYDEWYKGERGFAATAFTTCAFGIAALHLGENIAPADRDVLIATLTRAGAWLSEREDIVKINHEIVAVAALAVLWKLTGETRWRAAAEHKLEVSLAHRNAEGWFQELGGADLGYSGLCIDYLMIYFQMTGDARATAAASKLLEFLAPHLHPDMTVAAEAGTCRNPYVGQVGFLLLAPHDRRAAAVVSALKTLADSTSRISTYLSDDLRLARWALLPVLAALSTARGVPSSGEGPSTLYPAHWTIHDEAALAAYHRDELHIYVAVAGGGVLRAYRGGKLVFEDRGPSVRLNGESYSARIYDAERTILRSAGGISSSMQLAKVSYLFPSFLKRLVLRFGSATPASSRLMRALIDRYRLKNRSAVNQSASSVGGGESRFTLARNVEIAGQSLTVTDILRDAKGGLSSAALTFDMKLNGIAAKIDFPGFADAREFHLKTTVDLGAAEVAAWSVAAHV